MIVGIIGTLIGLGVLGAGIYYLKNDKEDSSKKIYGSISVIGAVIAIASIIIIIGSL